MFSLVTNFHYAFIYLFFMKEIHAVKNQAPLEAIPLPFYQVCFPLEHHLGDKFPSILFSCQILIRFLGSSHILFIFAPIQCSFPYLWSTRSNLGLRLGTSSWCFSFGAANISQSRHNMCTNS